MPNLRPEQTSEPLSTSMVSSATFRSGDVDCLHQRFIVQGSEFRVQGFEFVFGVGELVRDVGGQVEREFRRGDSGDFLGEVGEDGVMHLHAQQRLVHAPANSGGDVLSFIIIVGVQGLGFGVQSLGFGVYAWMCESFSWTFQTETSSSGTCTGCEFQERV